jgi:hypothetical protein
MSTRLPSPRLLIDRVIGLRLDKPLLIPTYGGGGTYVETGAAGPEISPRTTRFLGLRYH